MSALFDIQAIQSPAHAERGIARYVLNLAEALERGHSGVVSGYVLNPDLPVPSSIEPLLGRGRVTFSDRANISSGSIYHVGSPIEAVPLDRLHPPGASRSRVVVTLYDLIPKLFPETYLTTAATQAWYGMRLELIRRSDRILAISESTARDAVEELGVPAERVVTVGAGVSDQFARPGDREAAFAELRRRHRWLDQGFVLYTGGIEPRKNIDRLLVAYAGLPDALVQRHQLVIVCKVLSSELASLRRRLRKLGIAGRVHFPGYVSDEELVRLYQTCELFVFPALYEGFGLPVAEAIACGAPVISSNTSALPELLRDQEALFDPRDVDAIRAALARALGDEPLRARLASVELDQRHRWSGVAERTAEVYEELAGEPPRPHRRRTRVAFVSPLPPARSGIADASSSFLEELASRWDIDAFADQDEATVPEGVHFQPIRRFDVARRAAGGYDRVIVCLGNSEHHAEALALLRRHRAVVIAHDVRLAGLYAWLGANRPDLEPRGLRGALFSMYENRLPSDLGGSGWVDVADYQRYGVLMAREVISLAERYLVHSSYAGDLARLDAAPEDEAKIGVLPFGISPPADSDALHAPADTEPIVATFGIVGPSKQPEKLLQAFARLPEHERRAELVFAGPIEASQRDTLGQVAEALGVGQRVRFTGELGEREFGDWISRASVAVQLRSVSNGETSASITRCLAAGVPTVVTAIGSARELPDQAVVKVDPDVSASMLAAQVASLLGGPARRTALREVGLRYVRENSFRHAADALEHEIASGLPAAST